MSDLLAARSQIGVSLAFHIVFAVIGIAMPLMMVLAERRWQVTGHAIYLDLAKRWAKGTAILFAVGAVSGTVLSFELGLLWPRFMAFAGAIIGMPFSLEGFAFFTEAIFLGIYLYGWDRISSRAHLWAGVAVAASGAASGVFVVIANAWMNAPTGFELLNGHAVNVDPIAAMVNAAAVSQTLHMTLAAYAATGFAVAGIHAFLLLKDPANAFHRRALEIALIVGAPAAVLQPISGDISARHVAAHQPVKLAAAEALFRTRAGAPLTLGGWPDVAARETRFGVEVPYALSLLAFHDPHAVVQGLDQVPESEWPNVPAVHLSFQVMVALGTYLALVAAGRPGAQPLAHARDRAGHAAGLHRGRGRVDGHRAGPAAVGDLRGSEDPRRGHPDAGAGRAVRHLHAAVLLPGSDRRVAPVPAHRPQSGGTGMARVLHVGRRVVTLADWLAGVIFMALNAYAVLGGADFGGGVWDLLAFGPRRERQRELIAEAIGPVWEANHVWLILAIVLLFTCFPPAFARLGTLLHIPLSLVLIGIVLRGSAFTFWRYGADEEQRHWGVVFAIASLITPFLLGTTAGTIASGALGEAGGAKGDGFYTIYVAPWLSPFPLSVGLFALITFAFLAAVYLTLEAHERELQEDFRRRALAAGVGLFLAAVMALLFSLTGAPRVRDGLIFAAWALPLHFLTAAAAITALAALWVRRWRVARVAAVTQVSLILWGWALSQYPYILPPDLSIAGAAAPAATLRLVLGALALGAVVLLPSLYYLFRVFKSSVRAT